MPVNLVPEDDLVPEEDLRAALRSYRVDPDTFEAAVRERLEAAEKQRADEPLARLSPFLRSAAVFLPLEVLAGCKGTVAAAKLSPTGGAYKLLGYLAFPAISLFVLFGATIYSLSRIRSIQGTSGAALSDQQAAQAAIGEWWRRHKWAAWGVYAGTMGLMIYGASSLLFLFYLLSFGLLLFVLSSLAKTGLGSRAVIGRTCMMGLMFLAQASSITGIGNREIHFVDQMVISAIFFAGVLILLPINVAGLQFLGPHKSEVARRNAAFSARLGSGFIVVILLPLMAWYLNPYLWPATPARIKHYVESFSKAPFSSSSWHSWEIVAHWAIQAKLDPDLTKPHRLLAEEMAGKQNRFVLSSAMRCGLLTPEEIGQLQEYAEMRRTLVANRTLGMDPQGISSLEQYDWVICAAALCNDLSPPERDFLEQRLLATLDDMASDKYVVLETGLRATQLLDVIGRPLDRARYRGQIHDLLRKFETKKAGWVFVAGGFVKYPPQPEHQRWWLGNPGSLDATAHAVELMELYGIPDGIDLNRLRSFLRPMAMRAISADKWIAAATRNRLIHLPGAKQPTWLEVLYYERSLLAAVVLVGLCIYATITSPKLKAIDAANRSLRPEPQDTAAGQRWV